MKVCTKCKQEKSESEFYKSLINKKFAKCKKCFIEYYENNKEKIQNYKKEYFVENKDSIYKYKKKWRSQEFSIKLCNLHNINYCAEECHICVKIRNFNYKRNHKRQIRERQKIYRSINKLSINAKVKVKRRKIEIRLRRSISNIVRLMIKSQGFFKHSSVINKLGYSIDELKKHLSAKFEDWMNWNNYGKYNFETWDNNNPSTWTWNLDHITPQSDLPYSSMEDDNFKKCWDLENLRPYSAKQNQLDGATKVRHLQN